MYKKKDSAFETLLLLLEYHPERVKYNFFLFHLLR